jgi:2'-5' RNA ligase
MLTSNGNGQPGEQTLGHFALVSYIPDPLARFLDDLRTDLTPGCNPRAHVTVLPPRPLQNNVNDTIREIVRQSRDVAPFRVEADDIQVFAESLVVYLGISKGIPELCAFYHRLNRGALAYQENFPYHPHITIAQNIPPDRAVGFAEVARERWAGYTGPRGFLVSSLSFVQHVALSIWADVATVPVGVELPVGS